MGAWLRLRDWVLRLFGVKPQQSDDMLLHAEEDAQRYFDIAKENLTAIIANSLATLAFGDGDVTIADETDMETPPPRIDVLRGLLDAELDDAKRTVAAGLGVGMVVTIPYSVDTGLGRKIYTSTVTKDRFFITGVQGTDITECVVLSDMFQDGTSLICRWTAYSVKNGVYTIRNKATKDGEEIAITDVPRWADIAPEVSIAGVERLPIGIFRCPTANRRPDDITGVPITFGCDATLGKIATTLEDIETEYKRKKVRVMADRTLLNTMYDSNGNVIKQDMDDSLFLRLQNSDTFDIDVFDPAIRESSYYAKLQQHFAFLEKEIGVSRGILTDSESQNATATEIRRAMYSTFCMLDDIHREYEKYLDALMYGINVLCNFYGIEQDTPYSISYDWSYALLEDSAATWAQKLQAVSVGAEKKAELRMFLHPDEDEATAQAVIDEIQQSTMDLQDMLGRTGNDEESDD